MDAIILGIALVILIIAVIIFLKKPKAVDALSADELLRVKTENDQLKISLARIEERAGGLTYERDKADKNLQDERLRYEAMLRDLNQELLAEKAA
jgi:DNA recombination protein RmuC